MTMPENSLHFSRETEDFAFVLCAGWRTHVPIAGEQKTTSSDSPCNASAGDDFISIVCFANEKKSSECVAHFV